MTQGLAELTSDDIRAMSYNELIGVVRETNRIPGGAHTVHAIANRCMVDRAARVLDIGTSTGSTAIELATLVGCTVVGIDINALSLAEARWRAETLGLVNVSFNECDATALPYQDESFDLVICGNVTSLVSDADKAVAEYQRVLRWGGHLAAVPMYYRVEPDPAMVEQVRQAIQVPIAVKYREEALAGFALKSLELVDNVEYAFEDVPQPQVDAFCDLVLSSPHLDALSQESREALDHAYRRMLTLFRSNLACMSYSVVVLRKTRQPTEPELFVGERAGRLI